MGVYAKGKAFNVPGRNPRRRRVPRRSAMVSKAKAAASRKVFETKVKNVIDKQVEVKQLQTLLTSSTLGNYQYIRGGGLVDGTVTQNGFLITNILGSMPISQGSTSTQRIGLAVSPKELRLKGYVYAMPYNATTNNNPNPFQVVMVVYKRKDSINNAVDKIKLNVTNNVPVNITSTPFNDMYDWNRSEYVIKKVKRLNLRAATAITTLQKPQTDTSAPNTVILNPITGDSRNPQIQRFNVTVPLKKELTYDAGTTNNKPANEWCGVGFYIINSDGTTPTNSEIRASIYMTGHLKYTDQ